MIGINENKIEFAVKLFVRCVAEFLHEMNAPGRIQSSHFPVRNELAPAHTQSPRLKGINRKKLSVRSHRLSQTARVEAFIHSDLHEAFPARSVSRQRLLF